MDSPEGNRGPRAGVAAEAAVATAVGQQRRWSQQTCVRSGPSAEIQARMF